MAQAESLQRDGLALIIRIDSSADAQGGAYERLALTLAREGKFAEAAQLERRALAQLRRGLAPDNPLIGNALRNAGRLGREAEGLALLDSSIMQARAIGGPSVSAEYYLRGQKVPGLLRLRRLEEASRTAAAADSFIRATVTEGDSRRADAARWVAMAAFARKDYAAAVEAASTMYEVQSELQTGADHALAQAECLLGVALERAGRRGEARPHLIQGCAVLESGGIEDPPITAGGAEALRAVGP